MPQLFASLNLLIFLGGLYVFLSARTWTQRGLTIVGTSGLFIVLYLIEPTVGVDPAGLIAFLIGFAVFSSIYSVLSLGLNIQWGYTGLFNIGVGGFFAIGAYTSALFVKPPLNLPPGSFVATVGGLGLPFGVGLVAAMIVSGIAAFFVGVATLKLREDYLAIATIGIAETIRLIALNEGKLTNGPRGIENIPQPLHGWATNLLGSPAFYNYFYLVLVIAATVGFYFALQRISRSPWGRVLNAIREDEGAANSLGKNTFNFKMQALILGAMVMGAAGSLYAHLVTFVSPDNFEPIAATFLPWVMLIVGGSGNHKGAIWGGFIIWAIWALTNFFLSSFPLPGALKTQFGPLRLIAIVIMLELVLLFRPSGMLGEERHTSLH